MASFPFNAFTGLDTASVTPTTSSQAVALNLPGISPKRFQIRVVNDSGGRIYLRRGSDNTVAANSSKMPMLDGATETFSCEDGTTHIAVLLDSGTASGKVYITTGEGD